MHKILQSHHSKSRWLSTPLPNTHTN